jgi:hypothetical protein
MRVRAAGAGDPVEIGDSGIDVDAVVDEIGERLAGELVDHGEKLDGPAGGGDIELVVQHPHVVGPSGPQAPGGQGGVTEPLAISLDPRMR